MLKNKFIEIKSLVNDGYTIQAKDECDNGLAVIVDARSSFMNIKLKFADGGADETLLSDFQNVIDQFLAE